MGKVFISYRRKDSGGYAQTLHDDLQHAFPAVEVFRDLESIAAGEDFVAEIERELDQCSVVLALIGPHWLASEDASGKRRIDNPRDHVRTEITRALSRSAVKVIPVLVGGAAMPLEDELPADMQALARRNAHELSEKRWEYDIGELCELLGKILGMAPRMPGETKPAPSHIVEPPAPAPELTRQPVGRMMGMARKLVWGVGIFFTVMIALGAIGMLFDSGSEDVSGEWTVTDQFGQQVVLSLQQQGDAITGSSPRVNVQNHPAWVEWNAMLLRTTGQMVTDIHFRTQGQRFNKQLNLSVTVLANDASVINTGNLSMNLAPDGKRMSGSAHYANGETYTLTAVRR